MRTIGISTGALNPSGWEVTVAALIDKNIRAVELSALRFKELGPVAEFALRFPHEEFDYVSFHAPSSFAPLDEGEVVRTLLLVAEAGFLVIAHPDCVLSPYLWQALGDRLLIENMDKRKAGGRTREELAPVFDKLPEARWCFDIGHAKQVDCTMSQAERMLREFEGRLAEVHLSDVDCASRHRRLNLPAIQTFQKALVWRSIPDYVPIILETPLQIEDIEEEMEYAQEVFANTSLASPEYIRVAV